MKGDDDMVKINIAQDFNDVLGGRFYSDGQYSGQEFFEEILKRKYEEAIGKKEKLEINLDGTFGYPSSVIDQSFGELGRKYGEKMVQNTLTFISEDQPSLENKIRDYIKRGSNDEKNI